MTVTRAAKETLFQIEGDNTDPCQYSLCGAHENLPANKTRFLLFEHRYWCIWIEEGVDSLLGIFRG